MTYSIVALDATTGDLGVAVQSKFLAVGAVVPASNWDDAWQRALDDSLDAENLEERTAAAGWIDPRVLAILRSRRTTT